jgi:hypothetical protein
MSTMKIGIKPKIRITLSLNNTLFDENNVKFNISCPPWDLELTTHLLERFEICWAQLGLINKSYKFIYSYQFHGTLVALCDSLA